VQVWRDTAALFWYLPATQIDEEKEKEFIFLKFIGKSSLRD
jgi:hypothetical protein